MKAVKVPSPQTFGPPGTVICDELIECTSPWKGVGQECYLSRNKNLMLEKGDGEGF